MSEQTLNLSKYLEELKGQEVLTSEQFKNLIGRVQTEPIPFIDNIYTISRLLVNTVEQPDIISTGRIEQSMHMLFQQPNDKLFPEVGSGDIELSPRYRGYKELQDQLKERFIRRTSN